MRVKVSKTNSVECVSKRIEAEIRAYNRDRRVNSISHIANNIQPPTCGWAKNPWLVEKIRQRVGTGE